MERIVWSEFYPITWIRSIYGSNWFRFVYGTNFYPIKLIRSVYGANFHSKVHEKEVVALQNKMYKKIEFVVSIKRVKKTQFVLEVRCLECFEFIKIDFNGFNHREKSTKTYAKESVLTHTRVVSIYNIVFVYDKKRSLTILHVYLFTKENILLKSRHKYYVSSISKKIIQKLFDYSTVLTSWSFLRKQKYLRSVLTCIYFHFNRKHSPSHVLFYNFQVKNFVLLEVPLSIMP